MMDRGDGLFAGIAILILAAYAAFWGFVLYLLWLVVRWVISH